MRSEMRARSVCSGVAVGALFAASSAWAQTAPAAAAPSQPATASPPSSSPSAAPSTPTVPPAATAASAPAAPVDDAAGSDRQFDLKIKGIEEKVNDLKEKIFRTKSRLLLLQETVLGGDISSSAKAVIFHDNEMGSAFVLESASYTLDGA